MTLMQVVEGAKIVTYFLKEENYIGVLVVVIILGLTSDIIYKRVQLKKERNKVDSLNKEFREYQEKRNNQMMEASSKLVETFTSFNTLLQNVGEEEKRQAKSLGKLETEIAIIKDRL